MGDREDMLAKLNAASPDVALDPALASAGGAPASLRDTLYDRISGSASRLASNPTVQGLASKVVLGPLAGAVPLARSMYDTATGAMPGTRDITSFQRDPDPVTAPGQTILRPVDPNISAATPTAAPTLDPKYTQVGRPLGGGVGFGSLQKNVNDARDAQIGAMDEERALNIKQGDLKSERVRQESLMAQQEAERQRADAESQQRIDADAQARHQAMIQKQQSMIDELGQMKVDPKRVFKNADAGTQFSMWVGGILGGMLAGANGGSNTSLDRLDKIIDRDITAQQAEIDNKKAALNGQSNLLAQNLAATGDQRLAAAATRNQMLEAAKLSLKAKSDELGIPEIQTAAQLASNAIEQKQRPLQTAWAEQALKSAQAAAAAAEAARRAEAQRQFENGLKIAELGLKQDQNKIELIKAGKESGKEDNAAITEATKRLGDPDLVSDGELIRNMMQHVKAGEDGKKSVMGFDAASKARYGAVKGASFGLLPDDATSRLALSPEERIARQDWDQLGGIFRHKMTGAGGNEKELADIQKKFEGAGSNEERIAVLERLMKVQEKREAYAKDVLTDEQKAELERRQRREGIAPGMPSGVRLK